MAEAAHSVRNILSVNAFGWNIYFPVTLASVKRHCPIHKFTCLACEVFELEALGVVQIFPYTKWTESDFLGERS